MTCYSGFPKCESRGQSALTREVSKPSFTPYLKLKLLQKIPRYAIGLKSTKTFSAFTFKVSLFSFHLKRLKGKKGPEQILPVPFLLVYVYQTRDLPPTAPGDYR